MEANGEVKNGSEEPEIVPSQTLYINNLNERIKKEGEWTTLISAT